MSKILDELNILRIKGRIWIPNKSLPLQIQIVGKKINTWFEEAPDNCWRPNDNAGLEVVIISFDEKSIKTFNRKIKEKFKILSDPKIAFNFIVSCRDTYYSRQSKMENPKIALKQIISDDVTSIDRIKCSKCGGAGNFKTHEKSRRTCLVCFGRGYINI